MTSRIQNAISKRINNLPYMDSFYRWFKKFHNIYKFVFTHVLNNYGFFWISYELLWTKIIYLFENNILNPRSYLEKIDPPFPKSFRTNSKKSIFCKASDHNDDDANVESLEDVDKIDNEMKQPQKLISILWLTICTLNQQKI